MFNMNLRISFSAAFVILIAVLTFCALKSLRSHKRIGKAVATLDLSLIPPMIGNLIIIVSTVRELSLIGCYVYFVGMDLMLAALVLFTAQYCKGAGNGQQKPTIMFVLLGMDVVQLLLNPIFGHAFNIEAVDLDGFPYYRLIPYFGQFIHRAVDYLVFFCVVLIFFIVTVKTAKIYRERYSVILIVMVIVGLWQTFYIFSRTPIDRSMIGFAVVGILLFYLSIYYRPLRLLDKILSNIATDMTQALFVYDPTGKCIWANETGLQMLQLKANELDEVSSQLKKIFGTREYTIQDWSENIIIGNGKDEKYYSLTNHFVSEDSKHLAGSYLMIRDNTEEQLKMKREMYNSTHDSLTDLFTKQYLYQSIKNTLNENSDTVYDAIFVDVKDFKIVNDIFGSAFGDKALQQIANWLRKIMADNCVFGRLGGDTFACFIPSEQFEASKSKIENDLSDFIVSDGNIEYRLLIQLGIYEITENDIDISVMFDRAHLAISAIAGNYKKHIAYYDKKLREKIIWDQEIIAGLSEALETMQIRPYLQPITDRSGKVVGAEALARWIHPKHGFMSPALFIPILEKNGLIVEVDKHIWCCACKILSSWKKEQNDMFISINISPRDFYFTDIVSEIMGLVNEYGIEPEKLRIEITETVMMTNVQEKFKMFDELRNAGFIVEMDDFGSGYSSLNLLKDMPVDVLKIDMKFLSSSDNETKSQTIIRNIIRLSEELNIVSLTEGVETVQQYSQLSEMGCILFQGYYFAKPLPQDEFEKFVSKQNSDRLAKH